MGLVQFAGFPISMGLTGLLTFGVSALVTLALTPVAIRVAHRFGIVDRPGPRKVHRIPIPRIGGVVVFVGFACGLAFAVFTTGYANLLPVRTGYWGALAACAVGMLLLGLVDDVVGVSFRGKFAFQILASLVVWTAGFRIAVLTHPLDVHRIELGWLSLPITVLWIVGITNAINLIDGLDGLAAGCALITTTTFAVIAAHGGRVAVTAIGVALVGSLVGFLRYNFNPARIFLGDSGSMFLGFVLAVISIHGSQKGPAAVATLAPLLVLGLPIVDTALAIARRLYRLGSESTRSGNGAGWAVRNLSVMFQPDRGHVHHQLLDLGLGHRAAVLVLYLVMIALGFLALAVVVLNSVWVALILVTVLALSTVAMLLALLRLRRRRRGASRPAGGGREVAPVPESAVGPR